MEADVAAAILMELKAMRAELQATRILLASQREPKKPPQKSKAPAPPRAPAEAPAQIDQARALRALRRAGFDSL